jgi:hypothetical protein
LPNPRRITSIEAISAKLTENMTNECKTGFLVIVDRKTKGEGIKVVPAAAQLRGKVVNILSMSKQRLE